MVAKRGAMDGQSGVDERDALGLQAAAEFGEDEWQAFFEIVRIYATKELTAEKEAQLKEMLVENEIDESRSVTRTERAVAQKNQNRKN